MSWSRLPGEVFAGPSGAGTPIVVTAYVHRSAAPCQGALRTLIRIVDGRPFPGRGQTVMGGDKILHIDVAPAAVANCAPRALGDRCDLDCQCRGCDGAAQCIPTGAGHGVCAISCSDDGDCSSDAQPQCLAGATPPATCGANDANSCAADGDCRFGERCETVGARRVCRLGQWHGDVPAKCSCDAECGFGQVCLDQPIQNGCTGVLSVCAIPCVIDADCGQFGNCFNGVGYCNCVTD